jgi:hypothetical protein
MNKTEQKITQNNQQNAARMQQKTARIYQEFSYKKQEQANSLLTLDFILIYPSQHIIINIKIKFYVFFSLTFASHLIFLYVSNHVSI